MPSGEETQLFLAACTRYRLALQAGESLTELDILLIRTKLFDVICELDDLHGKGRAPNAHRHQMDLPYKHT